MCHGHIQMFCFQVFEPHSITTFLSLLPLGSQLYSNWWEDTAEILRNESAYAWTLHEVIHLKVMWNAQRGLSFSLTCLTLFFELPTRNIPTVWRPAKKQTKSTVWFYTRNYGGNHRRPRIGCQHPAATRRAVTAQSHALTVLHPTLWSAGTSSLTLQAPGACHVKRLCDEKFVTW